jgi:hypothetical protein
MVEASKLFNYLCFVFIFSHICTMNYTSVCCEDNCV